MAGTAEERRVAVGQEALVAAVELVEASWEEAL